MNTERIFISVLSSLQPNTLAVKLTFNTLLPMMYLYFHSIYLFHVIPSLCLSFWPFTGPQQSSCFFFGGGGRSGYRESFQWDFCMIPWVMFSLSKEPTFRVSQIVIVLIKSYPFCFLNILFHFCFSSTLNLMPLFSVIQSYFISSYTFYFFFKFAPSARVCLILTI